MHHAILYIVIIKVCSNTFILFVFLGIVRLANRKSPPPKKSWKNLRHLPLGVGGYHFSCGKKKVQMNVLLVILQKISCRICSLLSRVQRVYAIALCEVL